jgi:two-component system chemotaxis response regulator CheY
MGKKVIVVDDSRTARQQVRNALSAAGYQIIEAVDGMDGITKMVANIDAGLVLCDVNMPNLDGIEMIESFRRMGMAPNRTFIMLTTEADPALVQRAKACGAKGWIVKPFKPDLLVGAVRKLIGDA